MSRRLTIMLALTVLAASAAIAAEDTTVTGFVDASLFYDDGSGNATFGLDQVELDVERTLGETAVIRADLEWVKDGDGWAQDLEQGYVDWRPAFASDLTLTMGKFNAPMGFELLDPHEMYQFSHALVFDYGIPTNLTGAMAAYPLGERFALSAWLVNGWDVNDTADGKPKTVGGRLDVGLGDLGGLGLSAISGKEWCISDLSAADPLYVAPFDYERTVFDMDLSLAPAEGWTLGGEVNLGSYEDDAMAADWTGLLLMAHYDVNGWLGWTARYDWFDDPDGYVFGSGAAETRTAITLAPTFVLGDGVGALLELRIDGSDQDVWMDRDGNPTDSNLTLAFETTCTF